MSFVKVTNREGRGWRMMFHPSLMGVLVVVGGVVQFGLEL
jgi:hypothetical protein